MAKDKKNNRLKNWLKLRYRFVILNDELFEEKFSLRLTFAKAITIIMGMSMLLITAAIFIVGASPIREYIPGYGNVGIKDSLINLQSRIDEITEEMNNKDAYINNIINIIQGKSTNVSTLTKRDTSIDYSKIKLTPGQNDSVLRTQMEQRDKYQLYLKDKSVPVNAMSSFFFFTPVKGMVTNSFSLPEGHYGVDVAGKENEIIKATLDGTVVFAGFSSTDGYVLQIQHSNNLLSVYKHNSDLTKKVGDYVKAGDPVGIIGNTGESSNGMHLHFELWYNGSPLNPQDYIVF